METKNTQLRDNQTKGHLREQLKEPCDAECSFEGKNADEIWETSYAQKLDSKKRILDYIDIIRTFSRDKLNTQQLQGCYQFIEDQIDAMKAVIKPNTILQLKKELNTKLGKFALKRHTAPENHFLKFFSEAYPKNKRYKEYTWVLMDINRINDEQILHTLKYINAWCFKNKLSHQEKEDITVLVKKLINRGNLKFVNQVKSLEGLMKGLGIKIADINGKFEVVFPKKQSSKDR